MEYLEKIQQSGVRLLWYLVVVSALFPPLAALMSGASVLVFGGLAAVTVGLVAVARLAEGPLPRFAVGLGLAAQLALATAALSGHPWQIDSHMAFFAGLAMLILLVDPFVILAVAGFVVVHHLALTLAMPSLIYPSAELLVNVPRTLFHGAIVAVETAVLVFVVSARLKQIAASEEERRALSAALAENEAEKARIRAAEEESAQVVETLSLALQHLADGRLGHRIDVQFSSANDALRKNFNASVSALEDALSEVLVQAANIREDSANISGSTEDLSRRTEDQAQALGRVRTTVDEFSQFMSASAADAQEANGSITEGAEKADEGTEVVGQAMTAMADIEESSAQIRKITGVIEEIAFQTNLLALNAGVEAARAGEAGHGFAIVATEVRALAQRSSQAASEIRDLIVKSDDQVLSGAALVRSAGEVLTGISTAVKDAADRMHRISDGAAESSQGIANIRQEMSALDQVTQQNAAMFEETSAASVGLNTATSELTQSISRFVDQRDPNSHRHGTTDQAVSVA